MIISIMAISGSVFAQTSAFPENAFVETEQIAASSSDYRKIDESGDGLVEPQASQNYSVQSQKNNQQNNSLSRNTTSVFSFISLFLSFMSLIISVYLLLRIRKMDLE